MKNNQLIVDKQETGKTTYLYNQIKTLLLAKKELIILDSATEHEEKSLLKKVVKNYENSVVINMQDKSQIVLGQIPINKFLNNFRNYFPYNYLKDNEGKIVCFDLSYFLEKGYDVYDLTDDINQYKYYRTLYNNLAEQIIVSLILMEKYDIIKKKVVVMDEIEFPVTNYNISLLQKNIDFLASVHPENSFGTFYESFNRIEFKRYQKRKE